MYWKIMIATVVLITTMYFFEEVYFVNVICDFIIKSIFAFGIYGLFLLVMRETTLNSILRKSIDLIKTKVKR